MLKHDQIKRNYNGKNSLLRIVAQDSTENITLKYMNI